MNYNGGGADYNGGGVNYNGGGADYNGGVTNYNGNVANYNGKVSNYNGNVSNFNGNVANYNVIAKSTGWITTEFLQECREAAVARLFACVTSVVSEISSFACVFVCVLGARGVGRETVRMGASATLLLRAFLEVKVCEHSKSSLIHHVVQKVLHIFDWDVGDRLPHVLGQTHVQVVVHITHC